MDRRIRAYGLLYGDGICPFIYGMGGHQMQKAMNVLVMCCMERTHGSNPTPTIVSSIPTPAKLNH